jgi:hypothetical protein
MAERKEKSQKRLEKCGFSSRHVENTAKTAGYERFDPRAGGVRGWKSGGKPPHSKLAAAPIEWLDRPRSGRWL